MQSQSLQPRTDEEWKKVEFNITMKLQGLLVAQLKETAQTETPACDMALLHKKPDLVSHIARHRIERMKEEEASMAKAQAGRKHTVIPTVVPDSY
eukprot:8759956-Alexandrium_andersonii.AAC.1